MSPSTPIVPDTVFTERRGIHYLGLTVSQLGFVWREVSNTDLGVDGYLEIVVNGAPIGLIAVQVKSGRSYIESPSDKDFVFRAEAKHVRYWLSYRLPVIIVVYDPKENIAYWHNIHDYFVEHDEVPNTAKVPIQISKSMILSEDAKERLTEIAASPDSTAHAMLALRGSRYKFMQELLTPLEMTELYSKRKWLGEWFPLDKDREEILLHSALDSRGPAWYWFREGSERDFIPYLKSALDHKNKYNLQREASLALAAEINRDAVSNLRELLNRKENGNILVAAKALASIPNLTNDDRRIIVKDCWNKFDNMLGSWSRSNSHELLTLIAKIGGIEERERIINYHSPSHYSGLAFRQNEQELRWQVL